MYVWVSCNLRLYLESFDVLALSPQAKQTRCTVINIIVTFKHAFKNIHVINIIVIFKHAVKTYSKVPSHNLCKKYVLAVYMTLKQILPSHLLVTVSYMLGYLAVHCRPCFNSSHQMTPLHWAAGIDHVDTVVRLVDEGADTKIKHDGVSQ